MSEEPKQYSVTIRVHLPGNTKETEYPLAVEAATLVDGIVAAQSAWCKATEPKNISIKEIAP